MTITSISNNIAALAATYNISRVNDDLTDSVTRLSSGERLVRASDDIVALSAGAGLRAQLASMRAAQTNVTQGISMLDAADTGIGDIIALLEDQSALAVAAQSGSLSAVDRANLDASFQDNMAQINTLAAGTTFNGISLLDGGLGTGSTLFNTDATASNFNPAGADISAGSAAASSVAIEAFDVSAGTSLDGTGAAGQLQLVDGTNTQLADAAFTDVDSRIYGQFSDFSISNVTYGASGTLTSTLNGVEYSGSFAHNDTAVTVSNGTNRIRLGTSALDVSNAAAVSTTEAQLGSDFANTSIMRTGTVTGVDFTDTRLEDAVGTAGNPLASVRLAAAEDNVNISNFQYVGNTGAADSSILSVQINGETFTASSVNDTIDDGVADFLSFENGTGEALVINIAGLTSGANTAISNIRTSSTDRQQFIDALNVGFSKAGGGLEFNVSGVSSDTGITVEIDAATTANLFGGQSYDLTTIGNAGTAETAVDAALALAQGIQAQIGATQARFEASSDFLTDATIDIDTARGNYLDTDITEESTKLATAQVMLQAGVAALAQANQLPGELLDALDF